MKKPKNSYCYVVTHDADIAESAGRLGLAPHGKTGGRKAFLAGPREHDERYIALLNDIGDYDIDSISEGLRTGGRGIPDFDSLISVGALDAGRWHEMRFLGDRLSLLVPRREHLLLQ